MGQILSLTSEFFPPKPRFVPSRDIPDLSDKVIIVTGSNSGIGKETIQELLLKNAKVYMAARTRARAEQAISDLKSKTGKDAIFLELDLADLSSVTRAAKEFKSKEPALHILFNSGGVMAAPVDQLTADGYDLQFGTNCLGHAHLTLLLIPELINGAKMSTDGKARVVNTSSFSSYLAGGVGIDFSSLKGDNTPTRTKMGTTALYHQSKYGNVLFSNELAKRYADQGIVSTALNPGNLQTELQRHLPSLRQRILSLLLYPAPLGALTQLWAGTSPETKDFNGKWLIPWARVGKIGASKDPRIGEKLWEWIGEQRSGHLLTEG
ncbi:hypothetical protein FRB94_011994 [Tulasnella sp. JGI-2019a]|nr:hypothetical protein FRB93_009301 [Tulasnella sp. JGI-2019a]KAG8992132.1 hypothetical protein FRB94_011994 [Tulasnella sp. JGI-2019a]